MKILFLHGWHSTPGGLKPTHLARHGHQVINPALDDDDFDEALRVAQRAFDEHAPDVVVASSRGGAVAMNLDSGSTPLVLLCPAWKRWGRAGAVKPGTVILHSRADEVIPFADSLELVENSGLAGSSLVEVGVDHRLADPEPLRAMLEACEAAVSSRGRPSFRIAEATSPAGIEEIRALFREYEAEFAGSIGASLCFQRFDAEVAGLPGKYASPGGRLLLATIAAEVAGCVGMRPLGEDACEMKRLYVRPAHRGTGLGAELVRRVMREAGEAGYRLMRLDTVPEMEGAIRLYRSLGFRPIGPYWENPIGKAIYF
jgi:ribosomal protein S18 acetylase RimI-like enzyme